MPEWLTAFDEIYYFMQIFYDQDTSYSLTDDSGTTKIDNYYGFADPDKPIFKEYNVTRFQPDTNAQTPGIQIVVDDERMLPEVGGIFGDDIESKISLYLITMRRQTLQYNDVTYRTESINSKHPHEDDTIMLLRAFVFQRLEDFKTYSSSDISWEVLDWTQSEYIEGLGGVEDMVALRLTFDINFQRE
jgi:hypothetical protein